MTDAKAEARKVKTAVHKFGVVHAFRDDEGRVHCVPGHSVELVGVYADGIGQADIAADLEFSEGARDG